jgi:IS5 family transposase
MLRLHDGQATLWEQMLPEQIRLMGAELERIDALLDDPRFLAPFVGRFACPIGRPTIPIDSYLRLMYLKHRHGLGYETLVKEVGDSLSWRRFCRIALHKAPPHPTTLMKLTRRFGVEVVKELNAALLERAGEAKLLRGRKLRLDTTCVEADVRYPTDSGLCAGAVSRLGRAVDRVKKAGLAVRTVFRDRRRAAAKAVRRVSGALSRGGNTRPAVDRETRVLHDLAADAAGQARRVLANAERSLRQAGRAGRAQAARLAEELRKAERVVGQTARRLAGETVIADRLVSLADPDARAIRRGKPTKPTEFGYKASFADNSNGIVVSHQLYAGNPADVATLEAAIMGARESGMRVASVYADRAYGNQTGDEVLDRLGFSDRVIPRQGRADPIERTRGWRRRYRFRAGCEGRISHLKRRHGCARSRLKGYEGAQIWVGLGVLTHNLDRVVALG